MSLPPELPPGLEGRLRERAAWLAGAAWVLVALLVLVIFDWLLETPSSDRRQALHALLALIGFWWPFAWRPMRDRIHARLLAQAWTHWRRFGTWPD